MRKTYLGNLAACAALAAIPMMISSISVAQAPPPLGTGKNCNRRHMCPLIRKLMGQQSHARTLPTR